jgi:flagellar biosynthesis protein FlhA
LVITVLNIVGGLIVGVAQHGMPIGEALRTYTRLTVGDGLVSQIPALIISTTAGLVVTRTATDSHLGKDLTVQIFSSPRAIYMASGVLLALGITPGLPLLPFLVLGTVTGAIGYAVKSAKEEPEEAEEGPVEKPADEIEDYLRVDPLELEIGYGLIPLVDSEQGGDLLVRITQLRKQCATEIGILIPPIRIRDNIQLKPNEYVIMIKGVDSARGELMLGRYLALNSGIAEEEVEGTRVIEPAFGLPATWIAQGQRERAEHLGYTVVEAVAVLTTHLLEVLKSNAHQILGRQEVQNLLDNLKKEQPALIEDLVPNMFPLGTVEKVLQNLLQERVSIRSLTTILETMADYGPMTKDPDILTEYARQAISETIVQPYLNESGMLQAITLDPVVEKIIMKAIQEFQQAGGIQSLGSPALPPEVVQQLYTGLASVVEKCVQKGQQPIIVTPPGVRLYFRKLVESVFPNLIILSYGELPSRVQIESIGSVRFDHAG